MRLIDADVLRADSIKRTDNSEFAFDNCFPYWQFSKAIAEAPTVDAAAVVRCKDCKYFALINAGVGVCNRKMIGTVGLDDFCSRGERRSGDA